jgi:hypothetical protein
LGWTEGQFDQMMLDTLGYGDGHFTINLTSLSAWTPTNKFGQER